MRPYPDNGALRPYTDQISNWNYFETKLINSRKCNVSVTARRQRFNRTNFRLIWDTFKVHHNKRKSSWRLLNQRNWWVTLLILTWEHFGSLQKWYWKPPTNLMSIENALNQGCRAIHLRAKGLSLKGACATKCSKFDFEKFENSIISLKDACAPMRGNRVHLMIIWIIVL